MKILKQIAIIFGCCILGEGIAMLLPFAFPSSVISLILMALLLATHLLKESQIKETSDYISSYMAIFFVPAGIGVFEELGVLKGQLVPVILVICCSLFLTFLSTCFTVILVRKLQGRLGKHA